jgi:UDP-N-acetylmuramoyl-L-alanyl-D-glutamate--2,6-diaminopimelate ligase
VRLGELIDAMGANTTVLDSALEVTGLAYDSRRVQGGDLFFGLSGLRQQGHRFVRDALAAGAVAAVVGEDVTIEGAPLVRVEEPRRSLAMAAARFHGHPSRDLTVVGVTGTNGKTTTTYLLEGIFRASGRGAGLIGTTGIRIGETIRPAVFTTPEAPELQALLREMADTGIECVAIELSSHALAQRRCYDLACDIAVFTNLSHDHLDYHGTIERYLDAKLMLFDGRNRSAAWKPTIAVVNLDDPVAPRVLEAASRGGLASRTFGEAAGADVRIASVRPERRGLRIELRESGEMTVVSLPLLGRYNAWNAAAAFAAARSLGVSTLVVATGLAATRPVPGRLERVDAGQPFDVVVDYAHTPDALSKSIAAAREHASGRLLLVFGCGGDRDRAKRPVMGRVAADSSDVAWITNDNPRSEDPAAIAAEILAGDPARRLKTVLDRHAAIGEAIDAARSGDVVLIAGKGHETTQTVGGVAQPFDDRKVAHALLRARAGARR